MTSRGQDDDGDDEQPAGFGGDELLGVAMGDVDAQLRAEQSANVELRRQLAAVCTRERQLEAQVAQLTAHVSRLNRELSQAQVVGATSAGEVRDCSRSCVPRGCVCALCVVGVGAQAQAQAQAQACIYFHPCTGSRVQALISRAPPSAPGPRSPVPQFRIADLGCRVDVSGPGGDTQHTGTLRYVGSHSGTLEPRIGVELDAFCHGAHDGKADGHRYFTCEPGFGMLLAPSRARRSAPTPAPLDVDDPWAGADGPKENPYEMTPQTFGGGGKPLHNLAHHVEHLDFEASPPQAGAPGGVGTDPAGVAV